jgi:hypothetical protein
MTRVNIVVEGQAEENFVREFLCHHLAASDVFVTARLVTTSATGRGGVTNYQRIHHDVSRWCRQDPRAVVTSFFDLYALPSDFPGTNKAAREGDVQDKVLALEEAFAASVAMTNFIPYLQPHEFEALILSDPAKLAVYYPGQVAGIHALAEEVARYPSPEHINDGRDSAPSKRILRHIPGYKKSLAGTLVAMEIGLPMIRSRCRHFDRWVTVLEGLGKCR